MDSLFPSCFLERTSSPIGQYTLSRSETRPRDICVFAKRYKNQHPIDFTEPIVLNRIMSIEACDLQGLIDDKEECLFLHNKTLGDAKDFANAMKYNTTLTRLVLSNVTVTDEGMENLEQVLLNAMNIVDDLQISFGNHLSAEGIETLGRIIENSTRIVDLQLSFAHFQEYVDHIFETLASNSSIVSFHFHDTKLEPRSTKATYAALGQVLLKNTILTTLKLERNDILDGGIMALAPCLSDALYLSKLSIVHDEVTDKGFEALAVGLKLNDTLTSLDLSGNSIQSVPGISDWLRNNSTLTNLVLDMNAMEDLAAERIGVALSMNRGLVCLDLSNNEITSVGMKCLANALCNDANDTLEKLHVSGNDAGNDGARAFARCLRSNETLKTLSLCGLNGIGNFGAEELLCALRVNSKLQELSVDDFEISDEVLEAIEEQCLTNRRRVVKHQIIKVQQPAAPVSVPTAKAACKIRGRRLFDEFEKEGEQISTKELTAQFKKKEAVLLARIAALLKTDEMRVKEIEELQEMLGKKNENITQLKDAAKLRKRCTNKQIERKAPLKRRRTRSRRN